MKKEILLIPLILLSGLAFSQNCNCADNFVWLKETFEKNDAGFQYVIDIKGEADYKKFTDIYTEKVKTITDKELCAEALLEWLHYFRKGHIWLKTIPINENSEKGKTENEKIRDQFKDWETYNYNENEFNSYISQLKNPGLEGIWSSPPYTIGIRKVDHEYIGFILEADGVYWEKHQVKFKIKEINDSLTATYFNKYHTAIQIKEVKLIHDNYLSMESVFLKRISPTYAADVSLDRYMKFQSTDIPLFEKLSEKTVIVRIPSFRGYAKKQIDSIIGANMQTITRTENLIIDVQNNGGGNDESWDTLIPLIYTNPIRIVGMEFLSTPLNNKRMEWISKDPDASADDKQWAKKALDKLNSNLGQFVNVDGTFVDIEAYDTIYTYPKNVGIVINGRCGSATEAFILAAKQSKKVKLFGTTTLGTLDISNMYSVKSPCKDMELGYCLSKSYRIPDFTVDDKGLQPDYYLDKEIPKYEWIDFVNKILSTP